MPLSPPRPRPRATRPRARGSRRPATGVAVVLAIVLVAGQARFTPAPSSHSVRVQPGDTLWGLAGKYGVTMNQLASSNGMRLSDVLLAGRVLQLPGQVGRSGQRTQPVASAGSESTGKGSASAAAKAGMRTFCTTYQAPTEPRGQLPSLLVAHPERMALRPLFVTWGNAYRVPPDLVEAVSWQESGWQNSVVSSANARGIGQLLPQTADFVNHSLLGTNLQVSVPADNIRMSAAFLGFLLRATGGQVCGAVASYYQGLGTLNHVGVLPVSQTYVRGVLGLRPRFR